MASRNRFHGKKPFQATRRILPRMFPVLIIDGLLATSGFVEARTRLGMVMRDPAK